jgi:Fe-S cluster assembly protein SufB
MTEQQTSPSQAEQLASLGKYEYGWADTDTAGANARRGLNEDVVRDISARKNEPEWMLDLRLKGLRLFDRKPMPSWGADLSGIDFNNIKYFVRSTEKQATTWDELPADIKNTYDRLGIPEAEKQRLIAGVAAQYESEVVYHKIREDLEQQGVLFLDTDTGLREHEDIFKEYFNTVIPVGDNKFAALNTAVWSGGSLHLRAEGRQRRDPAAGLLPDQHREHGPVRADPDHRRRGRVRALRRGLHSADLLVRLAAQRGRRDHREEGRPLPLHDHPELVEQRLQPGHQARDAYEGATMEWIDGNIGSKVTMKYPSVYLLGEYAKGEVLSVAMAGEGQHQDAGAKMVHAAPHTSSTIISKSIARGGGRTSYRGLVQVLEGSSQSKSTVKCDALLVDTISRSDTYPYVDIREGRRVHGARGDGLQGERGPALLPDEPGPHRGRGDGHDRARLHRADRQGTADGVRAGAQPAHRAADGGRGRMTTETMAPPKTKSRRCAPTMSPTSRR